MTDEQFNKQMFVTGPLTTMLIAATDGFVTRLEYDVRGSYEVVHVATKPGRFATDTFGVNVSCDSKWAIAKDVMAAVADRYE